MKRTKQITIGADIEVFVAKIDNKEEEEYAKLKRLALEQAAQNLPSSMEPVFVFEDLRKTKSTKKAKSLGKIIPCVGLFPGTKSDPFYPKKWKAGYAIQEDNVMLEFNIPVSIDRNQFSETMTTARSYIDNICFQKNLRPAWKKTEHRFPNVDLVSPQAHLFACDPDADAYTGGTQRDSIPDFGNYRTCGGHIHIGGDFQCPDFVAVLFLELILSIYLSPQAIISPSSERAKWYGRPGIYRTKPYGIEYRTLSNAWACSPYSVQDIGHILFLAAEILINNSAGQLQQWFRRIEWTLLQEILTMQNINKDKEKSKEFNHKWNTIKDQFRELKIPGIQL